jgi:pectate lyase
MIQESFVQEGKFSWVPAMRRMLHFLLLVCASGQLAAAAPRLPAFPGADGAGKWSKGGRGGRVIAVTNLEDSGPGSLRAALDASGPRTVVFRVSGTIDLKTTLRIREPFVTVAGQTAPGDGICLKGRELFIGDTHDVIVRYLRCRPGDKTSQPGEVDAIGVMSAKDVILDHCSATWSTDECLSVTRDSDRVTVQHCLIAEALTSHGLGSIIASYRGGISFLHNLYASNRARNPRPGAYLTEAGHADDPGPRVDFRHNTLFNWSTGAGYTGSDRADQPERIAMNYAGNYLKPGADTVAAYRAKAFTIFRGAIAELFLEGNQVVDPPQPINMQSELLMVRPGCTLILRDTPVSFEPLAEKLTARAAHLRVLEEVGAAKPKRDAVDARIIAGVRDGTGRQPSALAADAWPTLRSIAPEADSDGDGLPDAWEKAHALDPNDPADAARAASAEGWTHLELWLNSL